MNKLLISLKVMENDLVAAHENTRKFSECIDTNQIRKYVRNLYSIGDIENALKEYELMKNIHFIAIDKENSYDHAFEQLIDQGMLKESKVELLFDEETQKKLKDYEWLKSVMSIDMYEQLPTPEDKIRFLEIMGVKL